MQSEAIDITLPGRRIAPGHQKRFEFIEKGPASSTEEEPGLTEFLKDASLSGEATEEEIAFLRALRFGTRRPTAFYYYRELQSLRDPLHFRESDRSRSR